MLILLKSSQLLRRYSNNNRNNGVKFGDIGTGAGFPGVVFSIISEIDGFKSKVILIDSNQKKCRFLNEVKIKLGLSYCVINKRSETLKGKFDILTCRAVSSVLDILNKSRSMIGDKTKLLLFKGKNWEIELKESKKKWKFKCNVVKNNKLLDSTGGSNFRINEYKKNLKCELFSQ